MTVVAPSRQYAQYMNQPAEPAGLNAFPITPMDGPLSLDGTHTYVPYNDYSGTRPALPRALWIGGTGTLEITLANDCVESGLSYAAVASNEITIPSHGFVVGDRVMIAGAGIPSNLAAETAYFVIVIDQNTIELATTLANAEAGTASTLTAASSGSFSVFKTTQLYAVPVGWLNLCVQQINAASTATKIVGLY